MEKITGKNNSIIKDTRKLFTSSKARLESGAFVLEGARLCFDVLNSLYEPDTLFCTQDIVDKYPDDVDQLVLRCRKAYMITDEISKKLSDTQSPQGIFLVVKMKKENNLIDGKKLIALDEVSDPANVGAIIRSAEALGIDGIITYNSCDIYNPKTIRATMGSLLRMNVIRSDDLVQTLLQLKSKGFNVYSTVPDSNAAKITEVNFDADVVCVIGNEANGVEENIKQISDDLITIPMQGRAESLNASVAASITIWEMLR